jgi:replication-associated recombination protein RarA
MRRSDANTAAEPPSILPPRANPDLVGHDAAERGLRRLCELDRLPHAILICGPRGIGKATLAFRFARFLLAQSEASALGSPRDLRSRGAGEAGAASSAASRQAVMPIS